MQRVSEPPISATNAINWLMLAGVAIVGYKVYRTFVPPDPDPGSGPGGDVDPAENDPRPATLTAAQAMAIADAIYVAIWGDSLIVKPWENDGEVARQLMMAQVSSDVALILNAYGERGTLLSPMNLSQTVQAYLDADERQRVNMDYQHKAIKFAF